jgi:O-antigen/teichoic acid export membrane protein
MTAKSSESVPLMGKTEERAVGSGIASGTALVMIGFVAYAVLALLFQLAIARALPREDVGRYFETAAVVGILLNVSTGGASTALVRFVAILERPRALNLARTVALTGVTVGIVFGTSLWIISGSLAARIFGDSPLAHLLRLASPAVPLGCLGLIWAARARGLKVFRYHFLAEQVALPAVRLTLFALAWLLGFGVDAAVGAMVAGFAASAFVGFVAGLHSGRGTRAGHPVGRRLMADFARFTAYRWGVDILGSLLLWADILIVGTLRGPAEAGTYSVATRLILFASVGLPALNLVASPFFAERLRDANTTSVSRLYDLTSRWAVILTCVPLAIVLAFPAAILRLFGGAFEAGATPAIILSIGFFANAAAGPVGAMLDMSDQNRLVLWDSIAAVVVNVALNLILIPHWGINGAALAWTVSLVIVNALKMLQAHRNLGILVLRRAQVSTAVALGLVLAAELALARVDAIVAAAFVLVAVCVAVIATRVPAESDVMRRMLGRKPDDAVAGLQ